MNRTKAAKDCLSQLEQGKLLLHPTDTIPGLGFHPLHSAAYRNLAEVKKRRLDQPCSAICASTDLAFSFFEGLSLNQQSFLNAVWPDSLTVIATASHRAPPLLVSGSGKIGLRVAKIENEWFQELLKDIHLPLPSTSVNTHGVTPAGTWEEAVTFAKDFPTQIYVPDLAPGSCERSLATSHLPSTILEFLDERRVRYIRPGKVTLSKDTLEGFGLVLEAQDGL
jgi:tRNA A37 threonylcarbamoyladenosine synthetase subunit TsaC/SUA5/YrdC